MGFRDMNVIFSHDLPLDDFPDLFFKPSEYDVLLMDARHTYEMLKEEGLSTEAHYFKLLRQARLEKLILNPDIIKYPGT